MFVDIGQRRPTVHASFMQRMADVLTSMMNRSSNADSPMSPVGSPMPEPSFPVNSNLAATSSSSFATASGNSEEIDCVTYESLGSSENQSDNLDVASSSSSLDPGRRLETTFSSFRIRQDSEQSVAGR